MIGRIIDQPDYQPGRVGKLCYSIQELTSVAITLRAIIQVDDQLLHMKKILFSCFPPKQETIDQEIAGFVAVAEKKERLAGYRLKYPTRHKFFLGLHVMIQGSHAELT